MIEGFKGQVLGILSYTWPTMVMGVVIAVLLRVTYLITEKRKIVIHEELFKLCFMIYILCLFYVVTFQDVSWSSHNFVPFKEILRYDFGTKLFYKNIFGNMLLFLPYGVFICKYVKTDKLVVVFLLSFITSLSIEVVQFLIGRVFDIDDIILNVIGCLIGFIMYSWFKNINNKLPELFRKDMFWNVISLLILGGLIWFLIP